MNAATIVLVCIAALHQEASCNSQCSNPIGTNSETQFTAVRDQAFYLNTDNPAPCSGTIDQLRYCYYRPTESGGIRLSPYHVIVAVYRRMVPTSEPMSYMRVSNVLTIVRWRYQIDFDREFECIDESFDFDVERGDILGVCILDPGDDIFTNRRQLDIVGERTNSSLMLVTDVSTCELDTIPSTIQSNELSPANSRILHLHATISVPPTTTMPPTEPTTTSMPWTTQTPTAATTPATEITTTNTPPTTASSTPEATTDAVTTAATASTTVSESPTTPMTTGAPTTTTGAPTTTTTTDAPTTTTNASLTTSAPMTTNVSTTTDVPTTTTDAPTTTSATTGSVGPATTTVTDEATTTGTTVGETTTIFSPSTGTESNTDTDGSTTRTDVSTDAQVNASLGIGGIAGIAVVAVLAVVFVLAVVVITATVSRKRSKKLGRYSPSRGSELDSSIQTLTRNGVVNLTYDGFVNTGTVVNSSYSMYDEVGEAKAANHDAAEGGNYCMLEESNFSGTYESISADTYSEVKAPGKPRVAQVNQSHDQIEGIYFENDYSYSSPEDSSSALYHLYERNKQEDIYGNLDAYRVPATDEYEIYSQIRTCGVPNISHEKIKITGHLGSGQFGNVERGTWRRDEDLEVALKTLKEGSSEVDKVKFLQEAAIMAQFRHPNIVTLHGVVSDKEPIMLVVEMMHGGDLRDFLHSIGPEPGELPRPDLPEMLLKFSQHVALGMQYLSGKGFVHRDLAARNILVSNDNICKVADFGMSRDLDDENYYISHGGKIPVKWTAPEAIHYKKYSTASDVWSYGCLLYEIWSLGHKPFEGSTNIEVVGLIDSNKRLPPPPGCPRKVYELMTRCWHPATVSRPQFREITIVLTGTQSDVLLVPQEALNSHKLAGVLAAPLEAGNDMYTDLQNRFLSKSQ